MDERRVYILILSAPESDAMSVSFQRTSANTAKMNQIYYKEHRAKDMTPKTKNEQEQAWQVTSSRAVKRKMDAMTVITSRAREEFNVQVPKTSENCKGCKDHKTDKLVQ
jgi:hypothetical protein